MKEQIAELIKESILLTKPTNYGFQVSINTTQKDRILSYIEKFFQQK